MDSVTHLVLGAMQGEVVLGRKLGMRAMLWGAAAGSLPDPDIVMAPFQDEVTFRTHRRAQVWSSFAGLGCQPDGFLLRH